LAASGAIASPAETSLTNVRRSITTAPRQRMGVRRYYAKRRRTSRLLVTGSGPIPDDPECRLTYSELPK
jgi:hypothetical protein